MFYVWLLLLWIVSVIAVCSSGPDAASAHCSLSANSNVPFPNAAAPDWPAAAHSWTAQTADTTAPVTGACVCVYVFCAFVSLMQVLKTAVYLDIMMYINSEFILCIFIHFNYVYITIYIFWNL